MSTPGSNTRTSTWRDLIVLTVVGAAIFAVVANRADARSAAIATGAYSTVAFMVLAYRHDARETAAEAALQKQSQVQAEPPQTRQAASAAPPPVPETAGHQDYPEAAESPREMVTEEQTPVTAGGTAERNGLVSEEEEAGRQAAVATQTISPALYGTGVVDEVSGQIGQVNLLETGLNVLAKVDGNGNIGEVNEGMEVVTGVPRDDLLGTDAFSYFTEPERAKGWFMEALQGSSVRDKEVEVTHQEGETTPLTYNVIATNGNGRNGGVLLCRYRED